MKRFPHQVALRLAFLAVIALGFAQAGAVEHAYAHDAALRAAVIFGDQSLQLPAPGSHDACDACLAYAPLLSGAGAPAELAVILTPEPAEAWHRPGRSHLDDSLALAFRSRAPPAT